MGKVSFIGAGPGDPRLLTLRGAELLARADVIVFDEDVHEATLDLAPEAAPRVRIPRGAEPRSNVPDLVSRARAGAHVVRLFYGDPFAFRGGAIELAGVREQHVEVEVVAGVIAPTAAAAYSGLALSRYEDVTPSVALAVVNEAEELHDWRKLSLATDTLALLTDAEQILEITHTLTYYGRKPETPAALVRNVSLPSQKVVLDTLVGIRKHIVEFEPQADDKSMVLLVVGDSIAGRDALRWFDTRPLSGKRILVTRAAEQGRKLAAMIRERGAEPVVVPLIEIHPPEDPAPIARAAKDLASYAWVCFTSENGVKKFFEVLAAASLDARAFASTRIAAIGPGTAAALAERGLRADIVAKESRQEGLAKALLDGHGASAPGSARGRVLLPRAKEAREVLPDALRAAGFEVDVVVVYETRTALAAGDVRAMLESRALDALTFTSASTVHALCETLGSDWASIVAKSGAVVVSIGPVTSEACAARGIQVDATASTYTLEGLVAALEGAFTHATR